MKNAAASTSSFSRPPAAAALLLTKYRQPWRPNPNSAAAAAAAAASSSSCRPVAGTCKSISIHWNGNGNGIPLTSTCLSRILNPPSPCSWISDISPLPLPLPDHHRHKMVASVPNNNNNNNNISTTTTTTTETEPGGNLLQLGSLLVLWYIFNIYFNIYNKQVLKVYPYPITITTFQFALGTVFIFIMWSTDIYKRPKISSSQILAILPLAIVHTLGNLFTNVSLGKVAVSFTHTIKATEPFFSVVLSALFLGEFPTLWILSSLVPIVGGVVLASLTEASFNWAGFWSAMASNLTNQSRNVLSKKFMAKNEESLDDITLFSIITVMSFFLSAPLPLFMEGIKFIPSHMQSAGLNLREIYVRSLLAGLCFHAYQQVSYMILARISPVTHSVANCVKRVVVIVASVLFFKTPVSLVNSLGTGVALAGVFVYSRVKRIKPKSA